ncbi:MAG: transposase [Rubrivivax sp.]|jgi:transposase|nr:transposase [Rubrivivax sp.]
METENSRKRRRHGAELKALILAECAVPGASVANVAMAHAINANIVHGWRKLAREAGAVSGSQQLVPMAVAPTVDQSAGKRSLELELRRGGITVKPSWLMSAAMDLSGWMCELLW